MVFGRMHTSAGRRDYANSNASQRRVLEYHPDSNQADANRCCFFSFNFSMRPRAAVSRKRQARGTNERTNESGRLPTLAWRFTPETLLHACIYFARTPADRPLCVIRIDVYLSAFRITPSSPVNSCGHAPP